METVQAVRPTMVLCLTWLPSLPNDIRKAEELPPIETDAANEYYIPVNNFSPIQWAAEHGIKATGEGSAEPADEPAEPQETSEPTAVPEGGPNGETLQEVSLNGTG